MKLGCLIKIESILSGQVSEGSDREENARSQAVIVGASVVGVAPMLVLIMDRA